MSFKTLIAINNKITKYVLFSLNSYFDKTYD